MEIIKNSNDHSILTWSGKEWPAEGVLAHSPAEFANSQNILRSEGSPLLIGLTNKGVHLLVEPIQERHRGKRLFVSILTCEELGKSSQLITIYLKRVSADAFSRHDVLRVDTGRRFMTEKKPRGVVIKPEVKPHPGAYVPQKHYREESISYEELCI